MLRLMSLSLTAPPEPPPEPPQEPPVVEPSESPKSRRRLPWRSPADQPRWARPALLALAAVAATVYAWRLPDNPLHGYYAPAVKSMSVSWRAFFYGGYDPAASITLDKLPGAFMVQALSARLFGFHPWSVVLP